jgi:hypothetical protein
LRLTMFLSPIHGPNKQNLRRRQSSDSQEFSRNCGC